MTFQPDRKYDVVLAWNVLHLIPDKQEHIAIKKIIQCLKDDGICIIAINVLEKVRPKKNTNEYNIEDGFKVILKNGTGYPERYLYTKERIKSLLSNFDVIKELDLGELSSNGYILKKKTRVMNA